MRWFFLIVGGLATAAMVAVSMRLNFLFGFSLGQTPEKAWVFGCVSVISDAWKGLGPVLILALLRERRWPMALSAGCIWIVCFAYSVTSALGVAIEDRAARTGSREVVQVTYGETQAAIARLEKKRKALREHRAPAELDAAIAALFASSVVRPYVLLAVEAAHPRCESSRVFRIGRIEPHARRVSHGGLYRGFCWDRRGQTQKRGGDR